MRSPLLNAELRSIGVDCAVTLLDRARHLAADVNVHAWWIRGDIRHLPLRSESVTGALLMDSFGFLDTDDENERSCGKPPES
jgi:hypothetical protein